MVYIWFNLSANYRLILTVRLLYLLTNSQNTTTRTVFADIIDQQMGKNFNSWTEITKIPGKGRPLASRNKLKPQDLLQICDDLNFSPPVAAIKIAQGDVECGFCRGSGEARYPQLSASGAEIRCTLPICHEGAHGRGLDDIAQGEAVCSNILYHVRTCEACLGASYEKVAIQHRLAATEMIIHKIYPGLQAVQQTHEGGITLELIDKILGTANVVSEEFLNE